MQIHFLSGGGAYGAIITASIGRGAGAAKNGGHNSADKSTDQDENHRQRQHELHNNAPQSVQRRQLHGFTNHRATPSQVVIVTSETIHKSPSPWRTDIS